MKLSALFIAAITFTVIFCVLPQMASGEEQPKAQKGCKPKKICKLMGGTCFSSSTCSSGFKKIPKGCKGKGCSCCAPEPQEECPGGYWKVPGFTRPCYKLFTDKIRIYQESKDKCTAEGATLATPANPVALRKFIADTFGDHWPWLGAQGVGTHFQWINGSSLSNTSPFWYGPYPNSPTWTNSESCLLLLADQHDMFQEPNSPFGISPCDDRFNSNRALCEI